MIMGILHFDGPIWRPPYESYSQLLQVTSGCTHHRCKFCTLYEGTPFRLSPVGEIEEDLKTIRRYQPRARRVFLTGANPFALSYNRLMDIALLVRRYLKPGFTIGCFARITDIRTKTAGQLKELRHVGFDSITIGTETGSDDVLRRMDKGYVSADIISQCAKLDEAGIRYNFTYLTGLAGRGGGERNARLTAEVYNRLHPYSINIVSLTLFPGSRLYGEMLAGEYEETPEHERLDELSVLIGSLDVRTTVMANTVSNTVTFTGILPDDRQRILRELSEARAQLGEEEMRRYRDGIQSL